MLSCIDYVQHYFDSEQSHKSELLLSLKTVIPFTDSKDIITTKDCGLKVDRKSPKTQAHVSSLLELYPQDLVLNFSK